MRIQRIERGLRLDSFGCDSCGLEVEIEELWSVKEEGKVYRIHVCIDCLKEMLLEEEGEKS